MDPIKVIHESTKKIRKAKHYIPTHLGNQIIRRFKAPKYYTKGNQIKRYTKDIVRNGKVKHKKGDIKYRRITSLNDFLNNYDIQLKLGNSTQANVQLQKYQKQIQQLQANNHALQKQAIKSKQYDNSIHDFLVKLVKIIGTNKTNKIISEIKSLQAKVKHPADTSKFTDKINLLNDKLTTKQNTINDLKSQLSHPKIKNDASNVPDIDDLKHKLDDQHDEHAHPDDNQ